MFFERRNLGMDIHFHEETVHSLKNAKFPTIVNNFYVVGNFLTSLEGSPRIIHISFDFAENEITTLKGSPERVGAYFSGNSNKIWSLQGSPKRVGALDMDKNFLTSIIYSSKIIKMYYSIAHNNLLSLDYAPNVPLSANF